MLASSLTGMENPDRAGVSQNGKNVGGAGGSPNGWLRMALGNMKHSSANMVRKHSKAGSVWAKYELKRYLPQTL